MLCRTYRQHLGVIRRSHPLPLRLGHLGTRLNHASPRTKETQLQLLLQLRRMRRRLDSLLLLMHHIKRRVGARRCLLLVVVLASFRGWKMKMVRSGFLTGLSNAGRARGNRGISFRVRCCRRSRCWCAFVCAACRGEAFVHVANGVGFDGGAAFVAVSRMCMYEGTGDGERYVVYRIGSIF
jgi:hypothetical protein